jgi:hypothetical protein
MNAQEVGVSIIKMAYQVKEENQPLGCPIVNNGKIIADSPRVTEMMEEARGDRI